MYCATSVYMYMYLGGRGIIIYSCQVVSGLFFIYPYCIIPGGGIREEVSEEVSDRFVCKAEADGGRAGHSRCQCNAMPTCLHSKMVKCCEFC